MIKVISIKDNILLVISNHRVMCRICACIQLARIKLGLNKELHDQVEKAIDVFLKNDEKDQRGGGILVRSHWICSTAAIVI